MAGNIRIIMFSGAKFKLEEANFFLSKMERNQKRTTRFLFYADAFISAACSAVYSIERAIKQLMRQLHKKFPENYFERIDELKNHVLFTHVRHPSQHQGILPIKADRPKETTALKTDEVWTVSYKVFNRLTPGVVACVASTTGIGNVIINVLNNVQLLLPEMRLIGDDKEISQFEVECEISWKFEFDDESSIDVLDACKSYFASIDTLIAEIEKEAAEMG